MRNLAIMCVLSAAVLSAAAAQTDTVQSWKSGETTVTLNNGILTVGGNGAMENYDSIHYAPWRYAASLITGLVIEKGVTHIGNEAFMSCTSLTFVRIPDGLMTIGAGAFRNTELTSVTIPNSVTYIGVEAFFECFSLMFVKIIGSAWIDREAFKDCRLLQYIIILNPIPPPRWSFYSVNPRVCMYVPKNSIDAYIATYNTGYIAAGEFTPRRIVQGSNYRLAWGSKQFECVKDLASAPVVVDDVIFNYDTTELIQYLQGKHRASYTIPSNVIKIAPEAFDGWNCTGPKSINVAAGNAHYSSEDGVLFNKDKTQLIRYPSDKDGASYAIPSGVTTIGDGAFYSCEGLTSITIPNSVTTIEKVAFFRCTSLTSVTFPKSVASIEDYAFQACLALRSITVRSPVPPKLGDYVFDDIVRNAVISVPARNYFTYRAADGWKEFDIKVIVTTYDVIALGILSALLLSAVVFVIVKKSRMAKS